MKINKWNNSIREYEPHEVPEGWNVKTYCSDLDEVVNCVCCGKKITLGEGYTS